MTVALYIRPDSPHLLAVQSAFATAGIAVVVNPTSTQGLSHAVSVGGDGMFLSAVRRMGDSRRLPLLGVNAGRLGFLATVGLEQLTSALARLGSGDFKVEDRQMLRLLGEHDHCTALNEFTIQKRGVGMVELELRVDGVLASSYWADGIIVSTPTGSTAYSMSVGGAILTCGARSWIISPIAPHNLSIRSLVVSDDVRIELTARSRNGGPIAFTLDNRQYEAPSGTSFSLVRSAEGQPVVDLGNTHFYDTLRQKLGWGVDLRHT